MKKYFILSNVALLGFFIFSSVSFAQSTADLKQGFNSFNELVTTFNNTVIKSLGALFMGAAMIAFFYGIVQYIWGSRNGKSEAITTGNTFIKWSLVALFVMFSVYGIIKLAQSFILPNYDPSTIIIPNIQFGGGTNSGPRVDPLRPGTGVVTPDPSANYGPGGVCPTGYVPDDYAPSGCAPSSSSNECAGKRDGTFCNNNQGVCTNQSCIVDTRGTPSAQSSGGGVTSDPAADFGQGPCNENYTLSADGSGCELVPK